MGAVKLLVRCYWDYSSTSRSFFPFLITSTVSAGGKIVAVDIFLALFLGFLRSLHLKSRPPIITPLFKFRLCVVHSSLAKRDYCVKLVESFANAAQAALVSAIFLLLPEPLPSIISPTLTSTVNLLSWSGPIISIIW